MALQELVLLRSKSYVVTFSGTFYTFLPVLRKKMDLADADGLLSSTPEVDFSLYVASILKLEEYLPHHIMHIIFYHSSRYRKRYD